MAKPKILITNVGTRNLSYKGKVIDNSQSENIYLNEKKGEFRELTELILAEIESEKKDIVINIIPELIQKLQGEENYDLQEIILFTSNQEGKNTNISKDTLFAGQILEILIKERFDIKTRCIQLPCEVVNVNNLIINYQKELKNIIQNMPQYDIIVCDIGGTPQQRSSLRITAEFLVKDAFEYWEVFEIADEEGNILGSKPKQHISKAYKKILDIQRIIMLIQEGNYQAALQIRESEPEFKNDLISLQLKALHLRSILLFDSAKDLFISWGKRKKKKLIPILFDMVEGEPLGNWSKFENYFPSKEKFIQVCEIFAVADFYWYIKDYTSAVLHYYIFLERFLDTVSTYVSKITEDKELIDKTKELIDSVGNNIYEAFIKKDITYYSLKSRKKRKADSKGMALEAAYLRYKLDSLSPIQTFVNSAYIFYSVLIYDATIPHNSHTYNDNLGLNKLRNRIAHIGKGVKEKSEIDNFVLNFEFNIDKMRFELGLSERKNNIYLKANKELEQKLKLNTNA